MRSLCFIPLAFLAGNEGFVIFAPYAAAVLLTAHVLRKLRRPALTPPRA